MNRHAYRPKNMDVTGSCLYTLIYWPEGKPPFWARNRFNIGDSATYFDDCCLTFKICYTKSQMKKKIKRDCGIWCPYIPLCIV